MAAIKYKNLPGVNLELLDGNLQIDSAITGPIVLIVDTAYSGPSNFQYLVTDSNEASAIYGSDSPLISKLSEVKLGGAQNIVLYRIGGEAAEIVDLFGADTLLATREETVAAGGKFNVYIGPEPSNALKSCIIIFQGDTIVYSNATGAIVDLGLFNIVGFDKDAFALRAGTPTIPVKFEDVITSLVADGTLNTTGDGVETTWDLPGNTGAVVSSAKVDAVDATYTISAGTGTAGADQIVFDAAPANLGVIVVEYSTPATVAGATYSAGENNITGNWKKYYELLDKAYADLETTIATEIVVGKAILDAPNIADGSVAADKLDYLLKTEALGEITYEWGTEKIQYDDGASGLTPDINLAALDSNGQPIVSKRFNEVNFVHQLGSWCHAITQNERFVLGVIGTSQAIANTTSAVAKWIGTLPQEDFSGNIIANGSGLLGNKFMSGSITRAAGFFETDSGFPDGNPQTDSNGTVIDIGKYLSVVMGSVNTPNLGSFGLNARTANGAGLYAGLLSTIIAGESTTNRLIPRVSLPYTIKKTKLDELAGAGYVSFQNKTVGTVVVSGELATSDASDYDYVSTAIIVSTVIRNIRTRLEPFIGKGLNQVTVAAAQTAVEAIFQDAVASGSVVKYSATVLVEPAENGRGKLRIPITIVPAFELREVNTSVKLAYDI
jgi:hypothetical protein